MKKNNIEEIKRKIELFKYWVNYYMFEKYNLYEYNLTIDEQNKYSAKASTYWHSREEASQMVTICYSNSWINNKDTSDEDIKIVAFHEVWEVILCELSEIASDRFIEKSSIDRAVHRIIRRMENTEFLTKTEIKIPESFNTINITSFPCTSTYNGAIVPAVIKVLTKNKK